MLVKEALILNSEQLYQKALEVLPTAENEAIDLLRQAWTAAEEEEAYPLLCDILTQLARSERVQGRVSESLEILNKAYRYLNNYCQHDNIRLSRIYREYGSLYANRFGNIPIALDYTLRSLSLNNPELKCALYNNIGCQYVLLGQFDRAEEYLTKGKQICEEKNDELMQSFIYENFGELYRNQQKYDQAIASFKKGCAFAEEIRDSGHTVTEVKSIMCYNIIGLAKSYLASNALDLIPELIDRIYKITSHTFLAQCRSEAATIEGKLFLKQGRTIEFQNLFERAMVFCENNNLQSENLNWLKMMIDLCEQKADYKTAFKYSQQFIQLKDEMQVRDKELDLSQILDRKELEILSLENRNREIKLQKDQLEQFSYIVAHDLKTPLSNISNFIGLFSRKYREEVDAEHQYYLDFAMDNSKKLYQMLEELLRYNSIDKSLGEVPLCNVIDIVSDVIIRHKADLQAKNGSIELHSIPQIRMQEKHLVMVMDCLIHNAIKFAADDKDCRLEVRITSSEQDYYFDIIDNGIGIDQAYQSKIFDLFKQLDKVNYSGYGMGLALSKKVVETYGGRIEVKKNDWGGATFSFNIPKMAKFDLWFFCFEFFFSVD